MRFVDYARALAGSRPGHGTGLVVLRQPASTHLLGRRIAREYSQEDTETPATVLLAWRQTAGRGRGARGWSSPAGAGVYATLIRRLPADRLQILPLLVAVSLCEALNLHLADRCRLKWPNDLVVGGRKLGGILIDATSRPGGFGLAVVSFGVNHRGAPGPPGATSVELEAPGRVALADLAAALVEAVSAALDAPAPPAAIVRRYRALSVHRPGDAMRCRLGGGELEGEFRGFDAHGFLRLRVAGEERLVAAGEVSSDG